MQQDATLKDKNRQSYQLQKENMYNRNVIRIKEKL
jgi:hypothetical protein